MKASVAYEDSKEAKRKLKSIKHLRWHRTSFGLEAKGTRGKYALVHRSPDRRHGVFPWSVRQGGAKGPELKVGGFDLASEAKDYASLFDAGLCGAPAQPEGIFKGTLAGEQDKEPSDKYETEVTRAVAKMIGQGRGPDGTLLPATPDAYDIVGNSPEYVAQMEQGGVDPNIVAAVLVATKAHGHAHDCPAKHVELAEAAEEHGYPRHHLETLTFRGRHFQIYFGGHTNTWHYVLPGGSKKGGFISRDEAMIAAQRALGMLSTASVAVEGAGESRMSRIKWRKIYESRDSVIWQGWEGDGDTPGEHDVFSIVRNQLGPDQGMRFALKVSHPDGSNEKKIGDYFTLIDARLAAVDYLSGELEKPTVAQLIAQRRGGTESAAETKKRLWQPDPSTGLWITHSSLTRDYFLMRGETLEGRFPTRGEAETAAKDLAKVAEAAEEPRRPKGPRRR